MKAESLSSVLASALILAACAISYGQQAPAPSAANGNPSAKAATAPPLTEDALRKRYVGQLVFVRGDYASDDLQFDENGKIKGSPQTTSFTLSAVEVRKVHLTKRSLEIEGDRYGLHFFGALPYEDASAQPYDKVKISKKPVRITIEREVVVIPKAKKQKKGKAEKGPVAPSGAQPQSSSVAAAAPVPATPLAPGTTSSPAHSAMMMNAALDNVLALGIDQKMIASLPSYWQEYFKSRNEHRQFTPAGARVPGDGVSAPKVLNSIAPSSNEYAQKYGIAGLTLFRTVVDASGVPQEIAIARPIGFGLDEKAVQAIKASRFTPATFNGQAVPAVIDVVVTFRIYSNRTKPGSVPKGSKPADIAASAWDSAPVVK